MNIKKIEIQIIPHQAHRYETVGDYWTDKDGTLQIRASEMSDNRYELLVALHELCEVILTEYRGIKEQDITDFDVMFEKEREEEKWDDEEPGWDDRAPYAKEHAFAECVERLMAGELKVNWKKYDDEVTNL